MEGQQRRHELFELAPPMDPPAGGTQSPAGAINRLRPVNLPGLSAGLAAISANYGGLFDDDSQQQHPFMGGGQFKSATFSTSSHQSASSSSSNNADSDGGAVHSLVAPLMAAAFRRPPATADAIAHSQHHHSSQHYHFPQSCPPPPLAYSPYATNGSQPSDPCTPTMGIGCLSNPAPAQSPYAVVGGGAFSPFSAAATPSLDQLGVNPFFWPWPPLFGGNGGGDIIGYTTSAADPHHQLLLNPHSAYNHLLSPQVDLYSAANSSSTPHQQQQHFLPDHLIVDGAIVHHQHPSPTKSTTSVKANSSSSVGVVQPKCQGNKVGAAKTAQMPRGQPRKGGRRPRETEQAEHMNDEDKERRAKRRERNKQAAARCRRRREERMQTLEEQVAQLQAENAEKERRIQQLAADRDRLMEALGEGNGQTNRNCRNHQQGQQQIMPVGSRGGSSSSTTTTSSGAAANSIGRILAPPAMNTRRRQLLHVPPFKLEPPPHQSTTTMVDPLSSPGTPPNGRFANGRGGGADGSMLVNGTDPVISESAESQLLFEPKRAKFEPMVSNSRTENGGGDGANANNRPSPTTNNNRPNSLQLDLLYKEGYVANTPSKELATFGQGSGGGGGLGSLSGLFGTPGNELITPGMSQLTELGAHYGGVLMAQQTGLTPCQIGPVPVLMQPQEERPPSGQLSELR